MEVSMDTSPTLSPLQSQTSYTSPTASRKRSVNDIDAQLPAAAANTESKTQSGYADVENQENADPSLQDPTRVSNPVRMSHVLITNWERPGSATGEEGSKNTTLADSPGPTGDSAMAHLTTDSPASKKRKLSPASKDAKQQEKEARLQEKEAKERQRLEEKAKREEEKRVRDEEKKKREADREEKRKAREDEKAARDEERRKKEAAKEEEKRKKEEEKLKKERAQPKLNAFFAKPKTPAQAPASTTAGSPQKSGNDGTAADTGREAAPVSDYQRAFPEFFLQSHTVVAPFNRFERDTEALRLMREKVDASLKSDNGMDNPGVLRPTEIFNMMPFKRRRGRLPASVREILLQMQALSDQAGTSDAAQRQQALLKKVRMKSLKFGEDVRPPYQGTYTKRLPESNAYKMMRNPFRRCLPETNYDYDSEVEWEEPEEGEELDSEEEEEMSEDGEDDMDGFLDDDDDQLVDGKRRLIVGDLEPICTGIRWHDQEVDPELRAYKIDTISDTMHFPIDPFSTAYWQKPKAPEPNHAGGAGRSTLHSFLGNPASGGASAQDGSALPLLGKAKRTFPPEQLEEFKQVVDGSDLTKIGLIELLKKRFPKVSKDILKDTLNSVATRVGQKEAEKKWVCK